MSCRGLHTSLSFELEVVVESEVQRCDNASAMKRQQSSDAATVRRHRSNDEAAMRCSNASSDLFFAVLASMDGMCSSAFFESKKESISCDTQNRHLSSTQYLHQYLYVQCASAHVCACGRRYVSERVTVGRATCECDELRCTLGLCAVCVVCVLWWMDVGGCDKISFHGV